MSKNKIILKICGLSRIEDITYVNQLKPNMVGFVFAKSKRQVTEDLARILKRNLDKEIQAAGVFVNEKPDKIISLLKEGVIDIAQLHGTETDEEIIRIQTATSKKVIKAFQMTENTDFSEIENCPADYVLLDSGKGTGQTFDWKYLKKCKRPFFLAGGLNAGNLREAIEQLQPMGVDLSSGVETEGKKDAYKIAEIISIIHQAFVET